MNTNEKLREALKETMQLIDNALAQLNEIADDCVYHDISDRAADELCAAKEEYIKPALALLRSNCDIYTTEEQSKRYEEYCKSHSTNGRCVKCPLRQMRLLGINCAIAWANLPPDEVFDKELEGGVE